MTRGGRRIAVMAGAALLVTLAGCATGVRTRCLRLTETAHWLEWQNWADPSLENPYEIRDSELQIPNVPGVGLEWNEKAVAAHLVDSV